jgi:hypothetical protein
LCHTLTHTHTHCLLYRTLCPVSHSLLHSDLCHILPLTHISRTPSPPHSVLCRALSNTHTHCPALPLTLTLTVCFITLTVCLVSRTPSHSPSHSVLCHTPPLTLSCVTLSLTLSLVSRSPSHSVWCPSLPHNLSCFPLSFTHSVCCPKLSLLLSSVSQISPNPLMFSALHSFLLYLHPRIYCILLNCPSLS